MQAAMVFGRIYTSKAVEVVKILKYLKKVLKLRISRYKLHI